MLAPPAPCHTIWDGCRDTMALASPSPSSSSQSLFGTTPLGLEISLRHTSLSPLSLGAKSSWGLSKPCRKQPMVLVAPRNPGLRLGVAPSHAAAHALQSRLATGWIKT